MVKKFVLCKTVKLFGIFFRLFARLAMFSLPVVLWLVPFLCTVERQTRRMLPGKPTKLKRLSSIWTCFLKIVQTVTLFYSCISLLPTTVSSASKLNKYEFQTLDNSSVPKY